MASDAQARSKRPGRGVRIAIAVFAALLALLFGFGGWLLATESGARKVFEMLSDLPGNPVRVEGVEGRIVGPLTLNRVTIDTEGQLVTLQTLRLDWRPQDLLRRELHILSLTAADLDIVIKQQEQKEPMQLPERLALPIKLRADKIAIDGGTVRLGPVDLFSLGALALNLDFDGARYRLGLQQLAVRSKSEQASLAASVKGEATLDASAPYALQAALSSGADAAFGAQTLDASGQIRIDGSLAEMHVASDLAVGEAMLNGRAVLRPFSAQPLGVADLTAQAVDLAMLRDDLPRTRLDFSLSAREDGGGQFALTNAEAGLYDEERLPLTELRVAFRQADGRFFLDRIAATLGSAKRIAGTVEGAGHYADGGLSLDLTTASLDLKKLDQRIRSTQLTGKLGIRHVSGQQDFTIDLSEPLKKQKLVVSAHAVLANASMTLERATLQVGEGRLDASGHFDLAGAQSFSASGKLGKFRLKDLGEFSRLPDLFLNGQFSLRGARQPALAADFSFTIDDSRIAGHALRGEGKGQLRADSVDIAGLSLMAGDNRLNVQGKLAHDNGKMTFALTAPKLEQIDAGFGGAFDANGTVSGTFSAPHVNASWDGSKVRIRDLLQIDSTQGKADVHIDRRKPLWLNAATLDASLRGLRGEGRQAAALSARLQFSPHADAPLQLDVRVQDLAAGTMRADSLTVTANGTTSAHVIDAALSEPGQQWTLKADGGLSKLNAAPQWQGTIQQVDGAGRFVAHIAAPAPLLVSRQRVQLDRFRLDSTAAFIAVEQFMRDQNGIVTRGRIERMQLAQLIRFAGASGGEQAFSTDLQMSGEWDVTLGDTLAGTLKFRRDKGDVVMKGNSSVALGLRELNASATAANGQISMQLLAEGLRAGRIEATGRAVAAGGRGGFAIAQDAPLSGDIKVDIPSLSWASALVSRSLVADGKLQSAITVGGSLSQPRLAGRISGSGLRMLLADTGVDLQNGVLDSEFQDSRLIIKSLRFGKQDADLIATGQIDFAEREPSADIAVKADRFALLDRSDRRLRMSGEGRLGWRESVAKITGTFNVNSGFFDVRNTGMPTLSDDVVIVGQKDKAVEQRGLPASIDIGIALGDGIKLVGRGVDAVLAGDIRFASEPGEPLRARGTLHVAKGTYTAYGRKLEIEQGLLRFNGPIGNPALDIVAMRRGQEVAAGVAVRGTVLSPRIDLVSDPTVPDVEKLSWLVLGRGIDQSGESDAAALQAAASAMLTKGAAAGVQSQIAGIFGLDELSVTTDPDSTLQERIVTLGKQVNSRLYVGFRQGIESATSVLRLRYTLSKKLSLEAEAGTRSALLLFYNISYD
ncbi:translocation/assembly module TamB domain-containing protein [Noviherbaspirillum cavernae]|nr:translocation/assembly module TamB domain-containing protein [Noviherbaspirillum cavernae]